MKKTMKAIIKHVRKAESKRPINRSYGKELKKALKAAR